MTSHARSNRSRPMRRRAVAESAATLDTPTRRGERLRTQETPRIVVEASKPGRLLVQLIRAGWSLNGRYYPAEVLRRDGPRAWPAGTLNFVDHATDDEDENRPAGSLRNLASYQTEAARWDEQRQALVAEVRLFAPWREAVTDWAASGAVGMSIRAWLYAEDGEAEGRRGPIVTEIEEGRSVDYVTVPAAGGAMLKVLESVGARPARTATAEARNIGAWLEARLHLALTQLGDEMYGDGRLTRTERITLSSAIGDALKAWTAKVEADAPQLFKRDLWDDLPGDQAAADEATSANEATSEEMRRALSAAVRAAHSADGVYVWLRDYDADLGLLWFERSTEDSCQLWQQSYTRGDNGALNLSGDAVEVVARVVYDPVPKGGVNVAQSEAVTDPAPLAAPTPVTEGALPTAPTQPPTKETSVSGNQNTGPAPGAGGAAEGQSATNNATATAEARALLAEQQRDEALARAAALTESQNKAASEKVRADAAEAENRRLKADQAGRQAVDKAMAESAIPDSVRALIAPRVTDRVVGRVPTVAESGDVDTTALDAAVTAAIEAERTYAAALLEAQGVGNVRGLGAAAAGDDISDEAFEAELTGVFKSVGMTSEAATLAAKGR